MPGFIIAVDHGANPGEKWDNSYRYILLPNVDKEEMSERVRELQEELEFIRQDASVHGVYSAKDKVWQYAFFQPDSTSVGGVEVASEDVAQIMLREETGHWILSVGNPMPDGKKQVMSFRLSVRLPQGIYTYRVGGIYPHEGETVSVVDDGKGSKVIVDCLTYGMPHVIIISPIFMHPFRSSLTFLRKIRMAFETNQSSVVSCRAYVQFNIS